MAERDLNRKTIDMTHTSVDTARKELQETQDEHEGTKKKLKETEEALASAMQKIAQLEAAAALPHGPPTVTASVQVTPVAAPAPQVLVAPVAATAAPVSAGILQDFFLAKRGSYTCPPRVRDASIPPKVGTNLPPAVRGSLPAASRVAAAGASAVDLDAILKRLAVLEANHTHLVSANAHALKHMVDQTHSKTKTLEDELKSVVQQVRQEVAANTQSLDKKFTATVELVHNRVGELDQRVRAVEETTSLVMKITSPAPPPPPGGDISGPASAIEASPAAPIAAPASAPDDGSGAGSP